MHHLAMLVFSMRHVCLILGITMLILKSTHARVHDLNNFNFDKAMAGDDVWLVQLYKDYCPECHKIKDQVIQASNILQDKAKVGAINMDHNKELMDKLGLGGIENLDQFGGSPFLLFGGDKENPTLFGGKTPMREMVGEVMKKVAEKQGSNPFKNFGRDFKY